MLFAFLSIVVFMCVAGFALYLDHQWFAGIFGMTGLVTIVSIFVTKDDKRKKERISNLHYIVEKDSLSLCGLVGASQISVRLIIFVQIA